MKKLALKLINYYQKKVSPSSTKKCRFLPTCSEYGKQCYLRFNFFYASWLTLARLLRCNPFHKMAYDPVPEEKKYRYKYDTLEDTINKIYFNSLLHSH